MLLPRWLEWAREIQALSQTGIHYAENEYQLERFQRLAGISAEIIAECNNQEVEPVNNLFCSQTGYATPRVDVRAAVILDDQLLMVRERMDGGWTLPGGWADVGDIPSHAAERETLEEAGYRVRAIRLVGVYDANRVGPLELFHAYKIVFLCEILDGEAKTSRETSEVAFFSREDIPSHLSGERTKTRHILDAFNAYRDPDYQPVFD